MKKRKINSLIGAFFALGLAVSVGTTLSLAKANKNPEIVLAEDDPETPISNTEDPETPTSNEGEQNNENSEAEVAADGETELTPAESSSESTSSSGIDSADIIKIILKTFRDALRDLKEHIKRWLNFFK